MHDIALTLEPLHLIILQDVASKMSEEAKQAKIESGAYRRQAETLERFAIEAKSEIGSLREERATLAAQVQALTAENRSMAIAAREASQEADDRIQQLSAANASLSKEAADLRKQVSPLHAEVDAGRSIQVRLREEAEAAKRGRAEAQAKAERAGHALAQTEQMLREAQASESRLARAVDEEQARSSALQSQVSAQASALAAKDSEVADANARAASAMDQAQAAAEETAALRREAETIAIELMSVARARAGEREEYEQRLASAMDDMRRIADEARSREASHAADAARHAEELIAVRREREAALEAAHEEAAAVQEMASQTRAEAAAAARQWEEQRAAYERRLIEEQSRAAHAGEAAGKEVVELKAKLAEAGDTIQQLRGEAETRGAAHLDVLSGMQAALRSLASDFGSVQAENATLVRAVRGMAGRLEAALGDRTGQQPLDAWYDEAKKTFLLLTERVTGERRRADAERDNVSDMVARLCAARSPRH